MRHVKAQTCVSASFYFWCSLGVFFCSFSWSFCSQCVARTDRSESSRGVSVESHFILVTLGSIRLATRRSMLDRVNWYWTGSRYPGTQTKRAQTSVTWIKWQILRRSGSSSGATHVPDQPLTLPSPRPMPCCDSGLPRDTQNGTGTTGNYFERPPAQEGPSTTIFNNSKNLVQSWYYRNSKEKKVKWKENRWTHQFLYTTSKVEVACWIILVELISHSGKMDCTRFPHLGNASRKVSWLYGISKLESQLQVWGLSKNSRSSDHTALDQRSWGCKVNSRTYDIAIDSGANRFSRLRKAWCDDCVCIEEASHACALPKKEWVSKSNALKNTTCSYEGDKLHTWSMSISVQLELMKQYKDSQICSLLVYRVTTSKIPTSEGIMHHYQWVKCLEIWSWKDCTSQNYRILLNFRLCWKGKLNYSQLKTSVKLHIDQMMRVRNDVVERRFDNSWSQTPQRGWWITEQSPVRCRCSRSCRSVDSISSVQNKDFTRDEREKVHEKWWSSDEMVLTANGEVHTHEEAHDLNLFVTV